MSDQAESTASYDAGASTLRPDESISIRWVFPRPGPAITWLERSRTVFGRDAGADVCLASSQVSRRHAEVVRSGPLWLLSDLESKNGIFVNGKRGKSVALSPGDVIRIGDFIGVVALADRASDVSFGRLGSEIHGAQLHRQALYRIRELGPLGLPVVLEGETGTGKELFARELHEASKRSGPFLAVNCAVYSQAVAAAELFGYRRGAFTGAERASSGHIRAAETGTLLLDELAELSLDVQAMLLRVIENHEVLPLGETRAIQIDVRFVAATQVPLAEAVEQGRFRADLRARLEGAVVRLPSLRDCRDILPDLLHARFEEHAKRPLKLSAAAVERLCLHDWALNIRELDTLSRRLAARPANEREIDLAELDAAFGAGLAQRGTSTDAQAPKPRASIPGRPAGDELYEPGLVERLLGALAHHGGNVTKAASELGISRQKAYRMLEVARRRPSQG
jgi:DNA-binding NtrC family response regulator